MNKFIKEIFLYAIYISYILYFVVLFGITGYAPQYLSYVFTGIPVSEFTSIGCHTVLWDYEKKDYHKWVYKEGIDLKLPPIVSTETSMNINYNGKQLKIGVGIHDSSSALLPYLRSVKKKFLLYIVN